MRPAYGVASAADLQGGRVRAREDARADEAAATLGRALGLADLPGPAGGDHTAVGRDQRVELRHELGEARGAVLLVVEAGAPDLAVLVDLAVVHRRLRERGVGDL